MKGDYPRFKATYAHEELVEHFLLSPAEQALVSTCRVLISMRGFLDRSNKLGRHGSEFLTHHISPISRHQPLSQRLVDQPLITLALGDHLFKLF